MNYILSIIGISLCIIMAIGSSTFGLSSSVIGIWIVVGLILVFFDPSYEVNKKLALQKNTKVADK